MSAVFQKMCGEPANVRMLICLTDVEGSAAGPDLGDRVKSVAVLQALLSTWVRPSHDEQLVVQGADTWWERNERKMEPQMQKQTKKKSHEHFSWRPHISDACAARTSVATVGAELGDGGPFVLMRIVGLATAQLVRVAIGPAHHVQLTLWLDNLLMP